MKTGSRRGFLKAGLAAALSPFYATGVAGQSAGRVRPFLHNLRRTGVTINWLSLSEGNGSLDLAAAGQGTRNVPAKSRPLAPQQTGLTFTVHHHRVDLSGLQSRTPYAYTVRQNGIALPGCEGLAFQTPGQGNASRLVILGDSGMDSPAQRQLAQMMTARRPDLMLHTGDLVYPSGTVEAYMERFFAPYAPLLERIPVFPCPGNHDYYCEQANFYVALHALPSAGVPEEGQGRYYSFDWENAHIVVLDSNTPLEEAVNGTGEMLRWLDGDLAASRQFWKIAMFHHPPYAGGPNQDDPLNHLARRHIVPILEKHGVQLVLNGHEHNYQRSHPLRGGEVVAAGEGIVYLTTGGGGADLYEPRARAEAAFQQGSYHFLEADLRSTELGVRAVRIDGAVIDTLALRPAPRLQRVVNPADASRGVAGSGLASVEGRQLASRENDVSGVRVLVGERLVPVVYAAPDQLHFVMPAGLVGDTLVRVETANGVAELTVTVQESAPAVLMTWQDDALLPALFHADGARVTSMKPARVGEELTLYFTGSGQASRVTIESGAMAYEARVEAVATQPGVDRVYFRVDAGTAWTFRVLAGEASSADVAWSVQSPAA